MSMPVSRRVRPVARVAEPRTRLAPQDAEHAIERILRAQDVLWKEIARCDPGSRLSQAQRTRMTAPSIAKVKIAQASMVEAFVSAEWEQRSED